MVNKMMLKIDLFLIIGSLVVLIFLVGYVSPLVISPLDNYESSEGNILFLIEKADKLVIDDNSEFTSPDEYNVEDGLKIDLEPGQYYWKAVGVLGSKVRSLTVESLVNLELREVDGESYEVVNSGNTRLNVDVYNGVELVDKIKLETDEELESQGTKFVGEMK
jgi:hypothetical protein